VPLQNGMFTRLSKGILRTDQYNQSPKLQFSSLFDGRESDSEVAPGSQFQQSDNAEFRSIQYKVW